MYVNAYGYEWASYAAGIAGISAAIGTVGCAVAIARLPSAWAKALAFVCGSFAAGTVQDILDHMRAAIRAINLNPYICYQTNIVFRTGLTAVRAAGNCY